MRFLLFQRCETTYFVRKFTYFTSHVFTCLWVTAMQ